jgi:hypothetical protein
MLLITFVELHVVAGRSRTRAGSPQAVSRRTCCAVALRRRAWSEHGMASVTQTRPHCVNQMGKKHSKPLAARHGRGTAWARRAVCIGLKGVALIKTAFSIPERETIEEMTHATFKCTTQYFALHPSLNISISCRHTDCASHAVKSATHKFRSHKYLRRYTRDVNMDIRPPLCPVSANTEASK